MLLHEKYFSIISELFRHSLRYGSMHTEYFHNVDYHVPSQSWVIRILKNSNSSMRHYFERQNTKGDIYYSDAEHPQLDIHVDGKQRFVSIFREPKKRFTSQVNHQAAAMLATYGITINSWTGFNNIGSAMDHHWLPQCFYLPIKRDSELGKKILEYFDALVKNIDQNDFRPLDGIYQLAEKWRTTDFLTNLDFTNYLSNTEDEFRFIYQGFNHMIGLKEALNEEDIEPNYHNDFVNVNNLLKIAHSEDDRIPSYIEKYFKCDQLVWEWILKRESN
jgi:hypothetical protein